MTGLVTQTLAARVRQQVESHGLVVWFDPEQHYGSVIDTIDVGGAAVEQLRESFFELRHRIEAHLDGEEPPKLVVYVPMSERDTRWALCEVVAAARVLEPGRQPPVLNTRLAVVARAALTDVLPKDIVEDHVRKVEQGVLTLAELDLLAEEGRSERSGVLRLVFDAVDSSEVALRFLAEPRRDETLAQKNAAPTLTALIEETYGVRLDPTLAPEDLRRAFVRNVLVTELDVATHAETAALRDLARHPSEPGRTACAELARVWRNRRDFQDAYVEAARRVEAELELREAALPPATLPAVETFPSCDDAHYAALTQTLLGDVVPALVDRAEARQQGFWATLEPEVMERWALLAAIARVRVAAARVQEESGVVADDAVSLVTAYHAGVNDGEPWSVLDSYHRHMEQRHHRVDLLAHRADDAELRSRLIARARRDYLELASGLAERFSSALAREGTPAGLPRQVETFRRYVASELEDGRRVAYVLVDALRYEMAEELVRSLGSDMKAEIDATLGTLPSITEIGMAALMPRADKGAELVDGGGGRIGLRLGERLLRSRKDRMAYLAAMVDCPFEEVKLGQLLPMSGKLQAVVRNAQLLCVTATDELDGLCEKGDVAMARRLMDDVLLQLRRAIRTLLDLEFDRIVITADHGFLFGEELEEGRRIDAPGGDTVDLHRRVWVGHGGNASEAVLRFRARDIGLGGDLEIAVPRSIAVFKARGASAAYFHGGASLQELVVPVIQVRAGRPSTRPAGKMEWSLRLGSRSISTTFLSVTVEGVAVGLFGVSAPAVRVEVRDGRESRSVSVAASYGFDEATGLVQLRANDAGDATEQNAVTLMLREKPRGDTVRIVLLDADTDRVLAALEDVAVTMADF